MTNKSAISKAITTLYSNEMTDQGLAALRERFPEDVVHDMTDDKQLKAARKVRTERNKLTEKIKDRRISVVAEIKTKADELTNEVELIFASVVAPFETQLEINKAAKEKAERELKELLDGQRIEISNMNNFVSECIGKSSQSISEVIEAVDLIDTTYFHKDIIHEAIEVKKTVCARLAELLTQAINEEALQIERQKLADQQAAADLKQRIDEKINNLRNMPMKYFGKTSKEIADKAVQLNNYVIESDIFGDRTEEATQAVNNTAQQLVMMAQQAELVEQAQADKDAQAVEVAITQAETADIGEPESTVGEAMASAAPTLASAAPKVLTVREFLAKYNESKGWGVDEGDLTEALTEGKRVYSDSYMDEHRWYICQEVVNEIDGTFIMFTDYIITGDNSMGDMDLSYDLDSAKIVTRKERQIIEVYYE